VSHSTADRTTAAAEALVDWLESQPKRANRSPKPRDLSPAAPDVTGAAAGGTATEAQSAGPLEAVACAFVTRMGKLEPAPHASGKVETSRPEDRPDWGDLYPHAPSAPARNCGDHVGDGNPPRLVHTDWLHHRLIVSGPVVDITIFRAAAAGAGTIPWHLDLDRLEEDWFHLLVSPPAPQQRSLSAEGARVFAGQLRAAVSLRHEFGVARVGRSRTCPFDLHALVPVPGAVLRLGPDDPASLDWLWTHWGTTQALRHVAADSSHSDGEGQGGQTPLPDGRTVGGDDTTFRVTFWSADWTPWQALARIAERWPSLQVEARPTYEAA
jgi:hypothetical protein